MGLGRPEGEGRAGGEAKCGGAVEEVSVEHVGKGWGVGDEGGVGGETVEGFVFGEAQGAPDAGELEGERER